MPVSDPYELTATAMATLSGSVPYAADANRDDLADPLPDLFIVFSEVPAGPQQSADDDETERFYRMQVSIYNRAGLINLPDTDTAMQAVGFRFAGDTHLPYNDKTLHYGIAREYTILLNLS